MGDFTSQYRVTYSDGTERVETRIDAYKASSNLMLYAVVLIAVVALIPAMLLLPLIIYVIKPYRLLKGSNPQYVSELLNSYGYTNLGKFQKSVKIKMWFLLIIFVSIIGYIDFLSFSKGRNIFDIFELQINYSIFLISLYLIIPFIVNKDRVLSKKLEGITKFNFIEKSHKKPIRAILTFLSFFAVPLAFYALMHTYLSSIEEKYQTKKHEMYENANKIIRGQTVDIVDINEPIISLNKFDRVLFKIESLVSGYYTDFSLAFNENFNIEKGEYDKDIDTMFFHVLTKECFFENDRYYYYKKVMKEKSDNVRCSVSNIVNVYKNKLGGDINAVDTYGHPLVVTSTVSEAIYQLIKLGANWKNIKYEVGNNEDFGNKAHGYDKKYNKAYKKLIGVW